jgi:23S rRNA pseudouridine1911/1915/1917 synthase
MAPRTALAAREPSGAQDLEADEFDLLAGDGAPVRRLVVGSEGIGVRLDKYLAGKLPEVSRSRIQRWIADDAVRLIGAAARARASVYEGDTIEVQERAAPQASAFAPEPMPLAVVWEDEAIIVID